KDDSSSKPIASKEDVSQKKTTGPEPVANEDGSIYVAPGFSWRNPIAGVCTIPGKKSYLFFDRNEPALWMVDEGSKEPRRLGRHEAQIKALDCSLDGSTAVTGSSDGLLHVWPLEMARFASIKDFQGNYDYTAFHDSVVIRDNVASKDE